MLGAELPHQFRSAPQQTLLLVLVESLAQTIRAFLRVQLQQNAVEHRQMRPVHLLQS